MKKITCITCPLGCEISVTGDKGNYLFEGAQCILGEKYALREITSPVRTVTTSVRIKSSLMPLLSVRTTAPVAKNLIREVLKQALDADITPPVRTGDIVIKNVCGTGIDLAATRSLEK